MKLPLLILGLLSLSLAACDSEKPKQNKVEENPLLKLQNDTANKAQQAIHHATQEQSKQLESIGQ